MKSMSVLPNTENFGNPVLRNNWNVAHVAEKLDL